MTQHPNYQPQQQPQKVTDPMWFRKNHQYLMGVTNQPSNPMLGIQNIRIKEASMAQKAHGFLYNGMISSAFGTVSFQIRVSKNGGPLVVTESRKTGVDENGRDKYFETVMLNVQAKAQILRFMEAVRTGSFVQPIQQQQQQQNQQAQYNQNTYAHQVPQYETQPLQQQQGQELSYNAYTPQYDTQPQNIDYAADVAGQGEPVGSGAPVIVGDDDLPF